MSISAPASVSVPGSLRISARVARNAPEDAVGGFVVLTKDSVERRIPLWSRVERPQLGLDRAFPLARPGLYRGTTVGAPSRVTLYRYPDLSPSSVDFPIRLAGPDVVYRFRLTRLVANFGVVVTRHDLGLNVQPRIVRNGDENRLAGYTALPIDLNPYRTSDGQTLPVAGVVFPAPGVYDIVFDSTRTSRRGSFAFRFWIGDTAPPAVRVVSASGGVLRVAVQDSGAGVDAGSLHATIDGRSRAVTYAVGVARVALTGVSRGTHELTFRASDYQETKNMENVGPVLPNTRTLKTTFVVP